MAVAAASGVNPSGGVHTRAMQVLDSDFVRAICPGAVSSWGHWMRLSCSQHEELSCALQSCQAQSALALVTDCYTYAQEHESAHINTDKPPSPERIRVLIAQLHSCLVSEGDVVKAMKPDDAAALSQSAELEVNTSQAVLQHVCISACIVAHTIAICTLRALASHHALAFSGARSFAWEQKALLPPQAALLMVHIAGMVDDAHVHVLTNGVLRSQLPLHPTRTPQHAYIAALRLALLQRSAEQHNAVGCYLLAQMLQQEVLGVQMHSHVPQLLDEAAAGGVAAASSFRAYVHLMHAHGQGSSARAQVEAAAAIRALLALSQAGSVEASLHYLMAVAYGVGSLLERNTETATAVWNAVRAAVPGDRFVTLGCRTVLDGVVTAPEGFDAAGELLASAASGHDGALAVLLQVGGDNSRTYALPDIPALVHEAEVKQLSLLECAATWCHQRESIVQMWALDESDAARAVCGFATAALFRTVAVRQLAERINFGHGCKQNTKRAEILFRIAAKRGDMTSIVALGEMAAQRHLLSGDSQDATAAKDLLGRTAAAGSDAALRLLGLLQFHGRCNFPPSAEAAFPFAEAARGAQARASGKPHPWREMRSADATHNAWIHAVYGACYLHGEGGLRMSFLNARAEFEAGAALGDLYCMYHFAFMVERGQGGAEDVQQASALYSKTRCRLNQRLAEGGQEVEDPPLDETLSGCEAALLRCSAASDAAWWRNAGVAATAGLVVVVAGWALWERQGAREGGAQPARVPASTGAPGDKPPKA
jgi:TPR repeat protein